MNIPNETIDMDECKLLVAGITARDQRTSDPADAVAWWTDLNRAQVRYLDAAEAVSRYYTEVWPRQDPRQRFRATPPIVIELVMEIRKTRLDQANLVYVPADPYETGAQFAARKRAQITAVANGATVPYQAQALSPRPVAALVAGVADKRSLPSDIAGMLAERRSGPGSIRCPQCSAAPKKRCVSGGGRTLENLHPSRTDAWATERSDCPECRVAAGVVCRQGGEPYPQGAHPGRVKAARRQYAEAVEVDQ